VLTRDVIWHRRSVTTVIFKEPVAGHKENAGRREKWAALRKDGAFSEPGEVTANRSKVSGVYVETFASGDKIFYDYQNKATLKDGAPQAGQGSTRWQAVPGK
jgi:hypothetical protein